MKLSIDGLKNANWKQLAIDHGEKIGLGVAVLAVAAILLTGQWGRYTEKNPEGVQTQLASEYRAVEQSQWDEARRAEDLPEINLSALVEDVTTKMNPDQYTPVYPITAPMHPPQEPGGEPTWLPVESVLATSMALPVRLVPEDEIDAATNPQGDFADPLEPDEPEVPDDFLIGGNVSGEDLFNFNSPRGSRGADQVPDSVLEDAREMERFGSMEGAVGPDGNIIGGGGIGGFGSVENGRGRGVKMIAVRGVFPYRRQVQELARSLRISFAEARARLEFLDMEIQRQRASDGPNPWSEPWEPVDRDAAMALMNEDASFFSGTPVEVVSPELTDLTMTMPLWTRAYGSWVNRPEATHPRIKEFDISAESPELRKKIEALIEAKRLEAEAAAQAQPGLDRRRTFGQPRDQRGMMTRRAVMNQILEENAAADEDPVMAELRRMGAAEVLLLTRFFDVAVEPGQAYRYRVRLLVTNPNFGLGPADVADDAALVGETRYTPWSDPSPLAYVPQDEQAFLTGVYEAAPEARPEAKMQVIEYSREYGTMVSQETRVSPGDLLAFEERNTHILDPFRQEQNKRAEYPFVTEHVVIDVEALPNDAAGYHPDLNLGNRQLPPGRVLMLLDTGAVREIDAGLELQRQTMAARVQRERDGLGPQLTDVNASTPEDEEDPDFFDLPSQFR